MGRASNVAGSSNNPRSIGSVARGTTKNRESRLPDWYGCGSQSVRDGQELILTQGGLSLIYGLFLWADKIQEENMTIVNGRAGVDNEKWKMKILESLEV
ncbi:hypothetical protein Ahy_B10g102314 [Arachis hypogaea]|uniref:Uncharacterized protein n=1 Tax=Arachis hypogaea TaxID=3818 RepID=A0A444X1G2_ARAHY|nr:hypothetical protein Ahy_B10g102314 [Arachis hypogaea]